MVGVRVGKVRVRVSRVGLWVRIGAQQQQTDREFQHTHQRFPEEFILGKILSKIQPTVGVHSPAREHLQDRLMVFDCSLW